MQTIRNDSFPCTGIENARFKYLRFKCADVPATVEFYTSLGMNLDGKLNFKTNMALKLSYKTSSMEFNEKNIFLLFEYSKESESRRSSVLESTHAANISAIHQLPAVPDEPPQKSNEEPNVIVDLSVPRDYLVIYVHFLGRLVKRLHSKGFRIIVDAQTYSDLQFAVVLDPNGIEIRLIELTDAQLNEVTNKVQWFARLAYYVIPDNNADETTNYYEALFSKQRKISPKKANGEGFVEGLSSPLDVPDSFGAVSAATGGNKKGGARNRFSKRDGFRMIDYEDIISGLTHTTYLWLSNYYREKACALCFVEKSTGDKQLYRKRKPTLKRDSKLVGIGFEVTQPLETVLQQLNKELGDSLKFSETYLHVKSLGYLARFRMPAPEFNLSPSPVYYIDIISSTDYPQSEIKKKSQRNKQKDLKDTETSKAKGGVELFINYNQKLRATMSESALMRYVKDDDLEAGGTGGNGKNRKGGENKRGGEGKGNGTGKSKRRNSI